MPTWIKRISETIDETFGHVPGTVYEMFKEHPNILAGYEEEVAFNGDYVDWDYEERCFYTESSL